MNRIFSAIRRFEKAYLSKKVRKSKWYFYLKVVLLFPLVAIRIISRLKINRTDKPPIVLANIVAGFGNLAFPDEQVEAMALKRASICADCPAAQETGVYSIIKDNRTQQIQGMKCADCGCNLSAKVRSVSDSCPRGKW